MKTKYGPLNSVPRAPAHLPREARTIWTQTGHYLLERGLLHSGDLHTIEAFAFVATRLRRIELELEQQPLFTEAGKPHPGISAANGTAASLAKLAGTLGLAPVARSRLAAGTQRGGKKSADEDEWAKVLPIARK